jgi:hypothetical protein
VGSVKAGPKVAAILSVVESCRRIGASVKEYLREAMPGLDRRTLSQVAGLTPAAGWQRAADVKRGSPDPNPSIEERTQKQDFTPRKPCDSEASISGLYAEVTQIWSGGTAFNWLAGHADADFLRSAGKTACKSVDKPKGAGIPRLRRAAVSPLPATR